MANIRTGVSVLVVEDDANTLHMIRDYLGRTGFSVRSAGNGWEAVKRAKDGPVDLIIVDLSVADLESCNLREKLALNPGTREIPFLYLVSQDRTDIIVRALRSGVDDCITKPFDPLVLVARVQAVLERRRVYEEMVRVDPLTRLLNRPTLERELHTELSRVERYRRPASLIMFDIDDFSMINSEGGSAMGDLMLTCISGVILSGLRTMDLAGRYHGEMFLVFLPETDEAGAEIVAARLQQRMSAVADAVAGYSLTVSCSIVCAPGDGANLDTLLPRLDNALQQAKKTQKGSIVRWSPDVAESVGEENVEVPA
jgi:diguanylate cyclase (GGDEF)-like protein